MLGEKNKVGVLHREEFDPESLQNLRKDGGGRRDWGVMEILGAVLTALSVVYIVITFPITIWKCARIIQEYERAVIFRLGRLVKSGVKGPGLFWIIPWLDEIEKVDLRTICLDVEPQQVLTADSVPLQVDAVVFYRVVNPALWVTRVKNGPMVTQLLAQTTLRSTISAHSLSQILSQRSGMAKNMEEVLEAVSRPWGVQIQRVELQGISLPVTMLRCMALEAEAHRLARAKLISAEGELSASRALTAAASSLCPVSLHLRYLQSLQSSADGISSVIVFPLPTELLHTVMSKSNYNRHTELKKVL